MSSFFNLALFPKNSAFIRTVTELAEKNLSGQTDKYLLGKQALPHITLNQFVRPEQELLAIWSLFDDLAGKEVSVKFSSVNIRPGVGPLHQGRNWVGLSVVPEKSLIEMQKTIFDRLAAKGIESLNKPQDYFPHLTMGRLTKACAITISKMPALDFWQESYKFELSLGRSSEIGVYSERLF